MKYPFVLFYRLEKYRDIDKFFEINSEELNCTVNIIKDSTEINKLYNPTNQILITFGPDEKEYHSSVLPVIAKRIGARWFHLKEIESVETINRASNYCFIHNCSLDREFTRPTFSIFTTCYNSYEKILRAFKSLKNQIFVDWEWVIIDDSPDEKHFQFLKENLVDEKIRLYKRSENSGNIGNVKNEAVSLSRGKYVLELDHDDEILPYVLSDSVNYFEKNLDVGFIYMDFINIYENGNNYFYGDFICKGYGGYYCQKYENKWVYVYNTPNINNITLSHLVCCPNHPRIWRKDVLIKAGNYCEMLPICDDYEILLRTANITKMAKISKLGYVQYMNENNNNFSLIRNKEINRIGPNFIQPIFFNSLKINDKMKELNAYEDERYINNHSQIWTRNIETYSHRYANALCNPDYDKQYCIIGINNLLEKIDFIQELYSNKRNDFILLDTCNVSELWVALDNLGLHRFKCYSFKDYTIDQFINYFKLIYKSLDNYQIIFDETPIDDDLDFENVPETNIFKFNNDSVNDSVNEVNNKVRLDEYLNEDIKNKMEGGYPTKKPFPFIVLDNFLKPDALNLINSCVKNMKIENATYKFFDKEWEKNKYAFESNHSQLLKGLFEYLNDDEFITSLEKLTGVQNIIRNDITLKGAGVHKSFNEGFLKMHTDFNMYDSKDYGMLDRRVNLLLYLNENWEENFNGHLLLGDMSKNEVVQKISPILNRCVIFNTTKSSIHGHPEPLNIPENISRNSIAVYYYTKTENNIDFEGETERPTMIYYTFPKDNLSLKFNTKFNNRHEVINSLTKASDKYLEIGVEYGQTFKNVHFKNKIGVDPDPKFELESEKTNDNNNDNNDNNNDNNNENSLKVMTSDDFFKSNNEMFDVIFIDGMHQTEYFLKDINNSIECLKDDGIIFIDDILPMSYFEQLKIPRKHYYEKGILKYGEPWTGDVWKVLFYILKNHLNDIDFTYFNNQYYRGVGMLKIINKFKIQEESIEEINTYDYCYDFTSYTKIFS